MADSIAVVEIHEFVHEAPDIGLDRSGFNYVYSPGSRHAMSFYAIVIDTEQGARGEYVGMWGVRPTAIGQILTLAPHLIGRDPAQRELIYDDFKRAVRALDGTGLGLLDICLWDLAGKQAGMSVSQLLGGYRAALPTYASTLHGDRNGGLDTPSAYADFAESCYERGFRAFKAHGWCDGDAAEEAALVTTLGDRVGGRMTLMLDPACELRTFADVLRVGRACDEAGFLWLEDPMRDSGISQYAHRKLRDLIRTPILISEHIRGLEAKADALISESTDFIRADPELDLGITGAMKIAHLAEAFGVDVEFHASGPAHRHCISAIRNSNYYEMALVHPYAANPLPPVYACGYGDDLGDVAADGTVPVPVGPGLGVRYDWDFVRGHRTGFHRFA
jgi:L-alanine-DL-glutamate epimerase-like enolase superfamily enzyme